MHFFLTIAVVILLFGISFAQGTRTKSEGSQFYRLSNHVGQFGKVADALVSNMPEGDLKNGLRHYTEIVSATSYADDGNVGERNRGISGWFEAQLSGGSCFPKLSAQFYKKIKDMNLSSNRPTLNSDLSQSGGDLKEGWLWKMALAEAGGNPNLALSLIGMCGHDDKVQGEYRWKNSNPESVAKLNEFIVENNQRIAKLKKELQNPKLSAQDRAAYRSDIKWMSDNAILKKKAAGYTDIDCPDFEFYTPGSLGSRVDIDDGLKRKIATIQAPNKGARSLPSKHYHVYGAAFVACQMIEKGVPKNLAPQIETQAAKVYRGVRICQAVNGELARLEMLKQFYNDHKISDETLEQFIVRAQSVKPSTLSWSSDKEVIKLAHKKAQEKIAASLDRMGAAYLYNRWYLGSQQIGNQSVPCTDLKILSTINLLEMKFLDKCVPGFSAEVCERSKARLATWMVDFEWTTAQHKVGADFAAKNCTQRKNETLDQMSCKALAQGVAAPGATPRSGVR